MISLIWLTLIQPVIKAGRELMNAYNDEPFSDGQTDFAEC
jgi:hypothetical protein